MVCYGRVGKHCLISAARVNMVVVYSIYISSYKYPYYLFTSDASLLVIIGSPPFISLTSKPSTEILSSIGLMKGSIIGLGNVLIFLFTGNDDPKDILSKLMHIKNKLGIKPPVFSPELEDTLCNLFMEIQPAYAKTCPDYRVNFLNYYYVLFKFCELLGEEQFLDSIPRLKDREKLIEQDETWKKMCIELNWEFIPSV